MNASGKSRPPKSEPRYRCGRCGEIWDKTELLYTEGDCLNENCDGIDENMELVEEEPDQGEEGYPYHTYFNASTGRWHTICTHESWSAARRNQ